MDSVFSFLIYFSTAIMVACIAVKMLANGRPKNAGDALERFLMGVSVAVVSIVGSVLSMGALMLSAAVLILWLKFGLSILRFALMAS